MRHFLRDDDLSPAEQAEVLQLAAAYKKNRFFDKRLEGPQTVALIFDKQTLRTQASFAAGVAELGGFPMTVDGQLAGIGERESVSDVARVLGRQADIIVWRTYAQSKLSALAAAAGVPVINALTDDFHPCQLLADLQTVAEHKGRLAGLKVVFVGDGACNMGNSWVLAGATAGMHVTVSAPAGFMPYADYVARAEAIAAETGGSITLSEDPHEAVRDADVVVTDTWVSMGKEDEAVERLRTFRDWQVDEAMVALAKPDAIVMHCLPAYRGKEIAESVLDGPQSVVWDEAENRRHAQKAIMAWLITKAGS